MRALALVALLGLSLAGAQATAPATGGAAAFCADRAPLVVAEGHLRGDTNYARTAEQLVLRELRALGVGSCQGRPANTPFFRASVVGVQRAGVGLYVVSVKLMVNDGRHPTVVALNEWGTYGSTSAENLGEHSLVGLREAVRRAVTVFAADY